MRVEAQTAAGTSVRSLGAIAAERGLLFGSAIDIDTLHNSAQSALYLHHARVLTSDNVMKFGSLRPAEGPADFQHADRLVAFCQTAGIPLRGHCLIWNDWTPDWVRKLSADRCAYWLDRHIDEVVSRYAGRLAAWDVVNEPFWPRHGMPGGFRDGPWFASMGKAYVVRAMKRARAADPSGQIALNEAGPEWEQVWGSSSKPYRDGILALIDEIQASGVRLDRVGLQCHWFPEFVFDAGSFSGYLHEVARRDVAISLSEIDINDAGLRGGEAVRDAQVAQRYRELIGAALREPKVDSLITWQLSDNASWLNDVPKLWGAGGMRPRPLPFDAQLRPKPAYYAIAAALADR
jgi:endo-1,4-beta-xylanase